MLGPCNRTAPHRKGACFRGPTHDGSAGLRRAKDGRGGRDEAMLPPTSPPRDATARLVQGRSLPGVVTVCTGRGEEPDFPEGRATRVLGADATDADLLDARACGATRGHAAARGPRAASASSGARSASRELASARTSGRGTSRAASSSPRRGRTTPRQQVSLAIRGELEDRDAGLRIIDARASDPRARRAGWVRDSPPTPFRR